jgi:hypothetical protein
MTDQRGGNLKKIPQPGEFNDLLRGQNSADRFSLRNGVDLVQMTQGWGFGHELPYALVESAIRNEVGTRVADALVFEGRPFPEDSRSIKVHLNISFLRCSYPAWLIWFTFPSSGMAFKTRSL